MNNSWSTTLITGDHHYSIIGDHSKITLDENNSLVQQTRLALHRRRIIVLGLGSWFFLVFYQFNLDDSAAYFQFFFIFK